MKRQSTGVRSIRRSLWSALLLAAALPAAPNRPASKLDFSRLIVLGDSLTAGFQNFSLFDSTSVPGLPPGGQRNGYAALIAEQAAAKLVLPLISMPGIPPAVTLTPGGLARLTGVAVRENPTVQATNLAVPGFAVADTLAYPFPGNPTLNPIDALSDVILGTPAGTTPGCGPIAIGPLPTVVSQLACAVALRPTSILLSIGGNDALQSLTFGVPPTNPAAFSINLGALLAGLASTRAPIVMSNVPDITALPFLLTVSAFQNQCGFVPAGAGTTDFVVPNITNPATTDLNLCTNYAVRSAALVAQVQSAVTKYNQIIATDARLFGAVLVDLHGLFAQLSQNGYMVNGKLLTTGFLGGLFSLDGIHPTNTGYAILANQFISTMNASFHQSIPLVSVENVANSDPLVP